MQLRGIVAHVNDAALQVAVQVEELTASAEESARTITSIQGETKGAVSSIRVGIDKVSSASREGYI